MIIHVDWRKRAAVADQADWRCDSLDVPIHWGRENPRRSVRGCYVSSVVAQLSWDVSNLLWLSNIHRQHCVARALLLAPTLAVDCRTMDPRAFACCSLQLPLIKSSASLPTNGERWQALLLSIELQWRQRSMSLSQSARMSALYPDSFDDTRCNARNSFFFNKKINERFKVINCEYLKRVLLCLWLVIDWLSRAWKGPFLYFIATRLPDQCRYPGSSRRHNPRRL